MNLSGSLTLSAFNCCKQTEEHRSFFGCGTQVEKSLEFCQVCFSRRKARPIYKSVLGILLNRSAMQY